VRGRDHSAKDHYVKGLGQWGEGRSRERETSLGRQQDQIEKISGTTEAVSGWLKKTVEDVRGGVTEETRMDRITS